MSLMRERLTQRITHVAMQQACQLQDATLGRGICTPPCVTCQSHTAIRSRCLPAAVHAAVLRSIRSMYGMSVHAPMQTKCSNKLPKVPAHDKPIAGNPPLHDTRPTAILYGKLNTLPDDAHRNGTCETRLSFPDTRPILEREGQANV